MTPAPDPVGALILGHGAGGGVGAGDLVAVAAAAGSAGFTVALVEQPYRVAGRRSPAPARQLDAAWIAVVSWLRERSLRGLPVVVGGRSAGARVACRTYGACGASGVLCLAFPLHPPGRPERSRQEELDAVEVPTLVIQGRSDPFGMPIGRGSVRVFEVDGDHSLRTGVRDAAALAGEWLAGLGLRSGALT